METFLSRDGTTLAYARTGSGPSLVLVHGTNYDHSTWDVVLPALAARFTVYALDRRGRGRSGDTSAYSIEREYEDLAALVDAVPGPVVLLGHSFGGICALGASLLTRNIGKLILYEPPFAPLERFGSPEALLQMEMLVREGRQAEVLETFLRALISVPEVEVQRMKTLPAWSAQVASAHTLAREGRVVEVAWRDLQRYAALSVPTMLMRGGVSPSLCTEVAEALQGVLQRSHLTVLPDQGHFAMLTAPELFVREVLAFAGAEL
ncbi:alpha/beta fold hydrolase [Archangium lansingense]|uniref:Alpha/beta hydrolase n=1 Tax=Archangium lansingense TaxID=2995310 RepID=A0ABT4A2J8_9BACT|nr:alpha/beta hydrolase [Archangium lansinium]MCY1075873.1 alpha/beta hydrolase [Archangium lansinium]